MGEYPYDSINAITCFNCSANKAVFDCHIYIEYKIRTLILSLRTSLKISQCSN